MTELHQPTRLAWVLVGALCMPISLSAQSGCEPDNAGLELPDGFCAGIFAQVEGRPRHVAVAPNGDVFIAVSPSRQNRDAGGVVVLWDANGDGEADGRNQFGAGNGDDVVFFSGYLYYSTNSTIVRYPWADGAREPAGEPEIVVDDLPARGGHRAKSMAISSDGSLYVNVGSPSNACMEQSRTAGSPGKNPCDELEAHAGVWRFDANRLGQTQSDGLRFGTGMRNTVALTVRQTDGDVYAVIHGRDQLSELWPEHYTQEQRAELPAEEFVQVESGDDFGWPYCYYDHLQEEKKLAPEYGGDGQQVGRCADAKDPLVGFPAHWAPNGILFYTGQSFPEQYHNGAFIAFHGSWNRAPFPQGGYNVVFVPFSGERPGEWEVFADGFAGTDVNPRGADHRPTGLALGPDGSLYVTDDQAGSVFRISYTGR